MTDQITMGMSPQAKAAARRAAMANNIGYAIVSARQAVGMSQSELAKRIGHANPSKVSRIESGGGGMPDALTLKDIADALGVSADYLLCRCDDLEVDVVVLAARQVSDALAHANEVAVAGYTEMLRKLATCQRVVTDIASATDYLNDGLESVKRCNSERLLGAIRAGTKLEAGIDRLNVAVGQAKAMMPSLRKSGACEDGMAKQMGLFS